MHKLPIKETPLHIQIVHLVRIDSTPEDLILLHVPNGGTRHPREAAKLKAMGVLAGAGDLLCHWPVAIEENGIRSIWMDTGYIEIKTDDGELTQQQIEFRRRIKAMGGKYTVARSYEAVRDTLTGWGVRCMRRVN